MPSMTRQSLRNLKVSFVAMLMVVLTVASASAATVNGVDVATKGSQVHVDVNTDGNVKYRSKTMSDKILVDVYPAVMSAKVKESYSVDQGLVTSVKISQLNADTVRVTVHVVSEPEFSVYTNGTGAHLAVSTVDIARGKDSKASEQKVAEKPAVPVAKKAAPTVAKKAPVAKPVARKAAVAHRSPGPPTKRVTLDFVDADLVYVLKVLAHEMGRNVYVGPSVAGSVSVTLNNVPVEGALALILRMQDAVYDYKVIDNTIVVATPEKLAEIPADILSKKKAVVIPANAVRKEFILSEAPASKVVDFLQGQYEGVKFIPHPTMNGFYAVGAPSDLKQIQSELANLDRVPPPPPAPKREFISVDYGTVEDVANMVVTMVPDAQVQIDPRTKMMIVDGAPGVIDQVYDLLEELDKPLRQVDIQIKVVDISESGSKTLGMTWGSANAPGTLSTEFQEAVVGQVLNPAGALTPASPPANLTPPTYTRLDISPFARKPFAINATLNFLVEQGDAKVLASPQIVAVSGEQAEVNIGQKYPIVYFDPRAGQFQVQYVNIGVGLKVSPEIKSDDWIVMDLEPKFSTLQQLVNNQYPLTAVRELSTVSRVHDGDTLHIGGLIQEVERQSVTKIPFLGDLPIVGSLFRNTSVSKNRNEVVILVTPRIVR